MKENFDLKMQRIIAGLNGERKKLLLHACCAPCSSACIERLKEFFDITVYFYNPNMDSEQEFELRASEQERLCRALSVGLVIEDYHPSEFYSVAVGLENECEGGARCKECFKLRLDRTAQYAVANAYDYFTTTLTISPLKNSSALNFIGEQVGKAHGASYLPADFKKKNGYLRSIELSKEYGLYRQNYCGCTFSKNAKQNI